MNLRFTGFKANSGMIGAVALLLICLAFLSSNLNAQKKYILFDNLDNVTEPDSVYYYNFLDHPGLNGYYPNLVKAPFSSATFSQYNITDFDLAIFPIGFNKLSYSSGSATVIGKIKEMIAAGKNVILTGRDFLNKALGVGTDNNPDVKDFLTNTMGIQFIKKKLVSSNDGTTLTWWSFFVRGGENDPVGISNIKACNFSYYVNYGSPLEYYLSIDVFKSKDVTKYFPVEHFIYDNNDLRNDTLVATRTEVGQSRIILYSMGFEAYCGQIARADLLFRCMKWALGNIKPDGAAIQNDPPNLDFDRLPVDSSRTLYVTLSSFGKQDLEITETSFWSNDAKAYTIVSGEVKAGGKSLTLKYGQTHTIGIKFQPKSKGTFPGTLSIYSNALVDNIKDIELLGVGGIDNSGPKIATNFGKLIDFGKVKKATSKTVDLKIFNDGDKELTIQQFKMDLTMPDNDRFTFAQGMNYPFFVKVKDSVTVKVKFAATIDEERVYNGKIIVECDAKNDPQFSIDLKGEIGPFVGVDEPIAVTGENFSMNISPNPASDNSELTCNLQNGSAKMNLYLTDLSGAKLMQISQTVMNSVEQKFSISTQALANGKYFVVAEIDGKTFVANFIVSK